ncbi:zeta toxin family protein [Magnaporthiopsis poae ATCC 64411]|uniref:Zeta toxin family protein n=1 Tax=Magnaporthiopsis poae (strain ATCC 64411 / 73-15) TaxID=644358 RepID=A0A0C4E665_MAGP6|nr:zeta toxin family protein [Magnaporthiopsis poae ATCC 64411]
METRRVAQDGQGSLAHYVLSDEESRRIFEQEIVPAELSHLTRPEDDDNQVAAESAAAAGNDIGPVAVLLVGQTGAGKTRTAPLLAEAVSTAAARQRPRARAHLIADTYKTYHPAYAALAAQSPSLASPATGPDARRWLAMACALAASRGADCIVESACRHPADFQDLVRLFTSSPVRYAVRVAVLAVPEALSRLGILAELAEIEALLRDLAADADEEFPDLRPFDPEAFVKRGKSV